MNTFFTSTLFLLLATSAAYASPPLPEAGLSVRGQVDAHGWPVTPDLSKVGRGEVVPTVIIAEILPHAQETPLDTIERAAKVAGDYTSAKGFEACATICKAVNLEGSVSVALRLHTNFSQIACRSKRTQDECPDGYEATRETIHTHPEKETIWASAVDEALTGIQRQRRMKVFPHDFSPRDLANGSGFLVTHRVLKYQNHNNFVGALFDSASEHQEQEVILSNNY